MIQLKHLEIGYHSKSKRNSVFKNINLSFETGDLVGLIGNNGVGKSTLLKTITGNLAPLHGEIILDGKQLHHYSTQELAQHISIVITEKIGGFNLTVWDVVATGRTPYINVFAKLTVFDEAIINTSLEQLHISHLKHKLIEELSDGQRQKVMIAKSLAQQTPIIILDEPTAFLDYNSRHHLFLILKKLCEEQHKLIIVSSHDLDLMKHYVSKTVELTEDGEVSLKEN
jgi:iron complex transport system ATP-binding protein